MIRHTVVVDGNDAIFHCEHSTDEIQVSAFVVVQTNNYKSNVSKLSIKYSLNFGLLFTRAYPSTLRTLFVYTKNVLDTISS